MPRCSATRRLLATTGTGGCSGKVTVRGSPEAARLGQASSETSIYRVMVTKILSLHYRSRFSRQLE